VNATAIILGRGGSKGLPRKNILPLAGKPCAQWTIEAAKNSASVSRVVVSSDDGELLALATRCGALALPRPSHLASDTARVDDAARHAIEMLIASGEHSPDAPVVILYANAPVRPIDCIDRAVERLVETHCDSVQSYQPVGKNHPWWTARVSDADGRVTPWEGDVLNHNVFRRQDLPPAFMPDGAVIALTTRALMLQVPGVAQGPHAFFGLDRRGIVNPEGSVVDIDSKIDMLVAEAMLSALHAAAR
jgi:CMP-N-acetylneuraminic acid synthetase